MADVGAFIRYLYHQNHVNLGIDVAQAREVWAKLIAEDEAQSIDGPMCPGNRRRLWHWPEA